jgi:hypothetical protein
MLYVPLSAVELLRFSPVLSLTASTFAPAISAPFESDTVPLMLPADCARATPKAVMSNVSVSKNCTSLLNIWSSHFPGEHTDRADEAMSIPTIVEASLPLDFLEQGGAKFSELIRKGEVLQIRKIATSVDLQRGGEISNFPSTELRTMVQFSVADYSQQKCFAANDMKDR